MSAAAASGTPPPNRRGPGKVIFRKLQEFIMKKSTLFSAVLFVFSALFSAEITVNPENAQILLSAECGGIAEFAAKDLQHHLKMITGKTIPVVSVPQKDKFTFLFTNPQGMKSEEARFEVTARGVTFAGDDEKSPRGELKAFGRRRTGSITAVAEFLERQLHIRWMEPGDNGVFYIPASQLKLTEGKFTWHPWRLISRHIRPDYPGGYYRSGKLNTAGIPESLQYSRDEYNAKSRENLIWMKHHRMGGRVYIPFGHSFTRWWKRYGKNHPEYFALFNGKRAPARPQKPETIKMCVSNEALQNKIVELWADRKPRPAYINICENDWEDYCECVSCRKLDVTPPGEKWQDHLSDRYFYFANQVLAKARKIDPRVKVSIYAYASYVTPPIKTKVSPGVVVGLVPSMTSLEKMQKVYEGWRKMGAETLFQRPNDLHCNIGLPMGFEKQLWQGFQIGFKNGIVGTDYDCSHGFWGASGVAEYILARAHNYPEASFEELLAHYCEGFGNAKNEIREYYSYWRRNIWEKRIMPDRAELAKAGRYGDSRRGLMWRLAQYYTEADFSITGKILEKAAGKARTPVEKKRIEWLLLCHKHFLMTYKAICAPKEKKMSAAQELLKFRIGNREKLNSNLLRQGTIEIKYGDLTGIAKAAKFKGIQDVRMISNRWYFSPDPQDEGIKAKWAQWPWYKYKKEWSPIYVDCHWENQTRPDVPEKLKKSLKNYDGFGWYAQSFSTPESWKGKKIGIFFGAVDEAALIYLNGRQVYTREFKNDDDWRSAFIVPVSGAIDWRKKHQIITVRVEDNRGAGGIWQPVFLVQIPSGE
ncbi:MAG: DUF4838 domain-containing protein [Lentisphaerae bacterium]|nr:DUF4838 domain-containing protein [Lentisphaerota bacterium]